MSASVGFWGAVAAAALVGGVGAYVFSGKQQPRRPHPLSNSRRSSTSSNNQGHRVGSPARSPQVLTGAPRRTSENSGVGVDWSKTPETSSASPSGRGTPIDPFSDDGTAIRRVRWALERTQFHSPPASQRSSLHSPQTSMNSTPSISFSPATLKPAEGGPGTSPNMLMMSTPSRTTNTSNGSDAGGLPPLGGRDGSNLLPPADEGSVESAASAEPTSPGGAGEVSYEALILSIRAGRSVDFLIDALHTFDTTPAHRLEVAQTDDGHSILHECAVHLAAGQEGFLLELLDAKYGVDVNAADVKNGGMTALQLVCAAGKEAIALHFIDALPVHTLRTANPAGWEALHFAAAKNRSSLIEALIMHDPQIPLNNVNKAGFSPLHLALKAKSAAAAATLVSHGADCTLRCPAERNATPLHLCLIAGFPMAALMGKMIQLEPTLVNSVDLDGRTPLHWSLQRGHGRTSLLLLEHGSNATLGDTANHVTPLHLAASANEIVILQACLGRLPKSQGEGNTTAESAEKSAAAKPEIDVDVRDVAGRTPLIAAAILGSSKTVQVLAESGADVDAKDKAGATALHWALKNKYKDTASVLLSHHCDLGGLDSHGNTPLLLACYNGKLFASVAEAISDRCPQDVTVCDNDGRSPLHWAGAHGHAQLITALLDAGATSQVQEKQGGVYPLHWAARQSQVDAVELLTYDALNTLEIEPAIATNPRDHKERTPLHWLAQRLLDDVERERRIAAATDDDEVAADIASLEQEENKPIAIPSAARVINFLVDNGADVDLSDSNGTTARDIFEKAGLVHLVSKAEERRSSGGGGGGAFGGGGGFAAFGGGVGDDEGAENGGGFTAFGGSAEDEGEGGNGQYTAFGGGSSDHENEEEDESQTPPPRRGGRLAFTEDDCEKGTGDGDDHRPTPPPRRATGFVAFADTPSDEEQ